MKLSIITINYNNREGLKKTIDSVVCQTWRDFEWIIIDGGSTDGCKELIEQYQDHLAYWCSEPDKGVYNAMNKGIAQAKGEYLIFMNSGDYFAAANVLEKLFACGYKEDIITGQVLRDNDSQMLRNCDKNLVRQLICDTLSHQGTFIKRRLFDNYSYREDYFIISDWIAWIDWLIMSNYSFRYVEIVIAIQEMKGISNVQIERLKSERERAMRDLFGDKIAEELPRLYKAERYLSGELSYPAIKGLRYLQLVSPISYSFLFRLIMAAVKVHDFFSRSSSFLNFEKENVIHI